MTQFYKCTRCGRVVELDLEDGCVPFCKEKIHTYWTYFDPIIETDICGGRLEPASKGENDAQE